MNSSFTSREKKIERLPDWIDNMKNLCDKKRIYGKVPRETFTSHYTKLLCGNMYFRDTKYGNVKWIYVQCRYAWLVFGDLAGNSRKVLLKWEMDF